jgi:hypothetical protein
MLDRSLIQAPPLELWPEIIRRVELPNDVEFLLIRQLRLTPGS